MEVYERLIVNDERNAPELVISGTLITTRNPYCPERCLSSCYPILYRTNVYPTADTVIIFPPQTSADAIINNPTTISQSSNARLTGLNTDITSAEESEDLGEGERNGEGSRDELSWSGRRGGIARILEKPADKKDHVSPIIMVLWITVVLGINGLDFVSTKCSWN